MNAIAIAGTRSAALADLDNVLISQGHMLCPSEAVSVLAASDALVTGIPVRVACGRSILRTHMSALASRGWGLTPVPPTPDAADRVLVADGCGFVSCGVTDLFVISGDGYFAALAEVARLHVIAPRGCLSEKLRRAASTVTYLPPLRHDRERGSGMSGTLDRPRLIRGSSVMIDPQSRFFDKASGSQTNSRTILKVGPEAACGEIDFDLDKNPIRGGADEWLRRRVSTHQTTSDPSIPVGVGTNVRGGVHHA